MSNKIIAWWSGGVTSAVACKLAIDLYGKDNVEVIFIDTKNEHPDTYRFKTDCQNWYGVLIGSITGLGDKYKSIEDVWIKHKSLNVANGAICSGTLKRDVRKKWQKDKEYKHQVFGFDMDEPKRARSMKLNNPDVKAIFPLLMYGLSKKDCIKMIEDDGIEVPEMYKLGFHNNNCFNTGCVQGGIGYWQKMKRDFPDKFDKMAEMEHKLTDLKGKPVTMLKDQSKGGGLVFLKPHPDYPTIKDISLMKGREPKPLMECNGFCGINDLEERIETENEINYQYDIFDAGA
jgi:3'-phosphoadenosine 5'-phosphosulfate sulfotransferase (PAPS reductase)/FAD synthetase